MHSRATFQDVDPKQHNIDITKADFSMRINSIKFHVKLLLSNLFILQLRGVPLKEKPTFTWAFNDNNIGQFKDSLYLIFSFHLPESVSSPGMLNDTCRT